MCFFFSVQLGIRKLTPAGLLVGAKSIVCHNKQLRTEMKELERELETLQGQNDFMVSLPVALYAYAEPVRVIFTAASFAYLTCTA